MTTDRTLRELLAAGLQPDPPARIGVAVSGGSDSMALLHLMAEAAQDGGPKPAAVTVDHHLRHGSGAETAAVARACAGLGLEHAVLHWRWDGRGNLEASARSGRMAALADWARAQGIEAVALAHTLDDQAETVLMRLARGSGVDGLAAMQPRRQALGILWLRPLLAARREALRGWLRDRGIGWVEDPMNADPAFDRVRARRALAHLAPLGITAEGLAATARWMGLAREALDAMVLAGQGTLWQESAGDVVIDAARYAEAPLETRLRLLSGALRWIASAAYRPRLSALLPLHEALSAPCRRTLTGCVVTRSGAEIRIGREPRAALAAASAAPGAPWDGRWIVTGPPIPGAEVRALGPAGLAGLPRTARKPLPRSTLLAGPAVWVGDRLIAAPLAAGGGDWSAEPCRGFAAHLIAH
ncbi:MAG: tRNA lysidine(34) synthetase TilS [Gemmobacter sp.]